LILAPLVAPTIGNFPSIRKTHRALGHESRFRTSLGSIACHGAWFTNRVMLVGITGQSLPVPP
jgi:hypothetical protein